MEAAKGALRGLVERIVLTPEADGAGLSIELHGALAALLQLATGSDAHSQTATASILRSIEGQSFDDVEELVLVAGVGFEPTTFRL